MKRSCSIFRNRIKLFISVHVLTSDKLPLPMLFASNPVNEVPMETESAAGERIRTFPYERGNWATYMYIACNSFEEKLRYIVRSA